MLRIEGEAATIFLPAREVNGGPSSAATSDSEIYSVRVSVPTRDFPSCEPMVPANSSTASSVSAAANPIAPIKPSPAPSFLPTPTMGPSRRTFYLPPPSRSLPAHTTSLNSTYLVPRISAPLASFVPSPPQSATDSDTEKKHVDCLWNRAHD